jgi:uncharacterized membrane protein
MQLQDINLMQVGTVIVFIGMIVIMIGSLKAQKSSASASETGSAGSGPTAKVAVGGFIGPIPFGFSNDKTLMYFLIGLMVFAMIIWFILINMHR